MRGEASLEGASADSTSRLITAEEARLVARLCPDLQGAAARRPADSLPSQPLPSTYPPDSSSSSDSDGASLPPRKQVGFSSSFAAAHRLAPIPLPAHAPPPKAAATLRGALRSSGAASCEPDFSPLRFAEAPVHIGGPPADAGLQGAGAVGARRGGRGGEGADQVAPQAPRRRGHGGGAWARAVADGGGGGAAGGEGEGAEAAGEEGRGAGGDADGGGGVQPGEGAQLSVCGRSSVILAIRRRVLAGFLVA
eukprot:CAMPEP_0173420758 /NCGR_PEP_ID=MMETSP1357-20121228/2110_1 /TAXON_ID=77926 /ORGANISM="Hemiselmis rufescens, Strain PCC563" /LENGTH=250 /DNA_ID=CAMNT_0014383579 /DNA_START=38 /DNA_END=789 /DNA_ORIENTATION=-